MNKLENLSQFTGTENYYRNKNYPFLYTDGIKYLAENGGAYWLLDAIASWQLEKIIRCDQYLADLQFWKLKVSDDNSAVLTCERDTDDIACEQKIPFTDFPIQEIGSSGFCVETRSILIVSSFKIVLKVLPSKHLTLHKQKLSHKVEKSRRSAFI